MQNGEHSHSLEEEAVTVAGDRPLQLAVDSPNRIEQRPPTSDERSQNIGASNNHGYDANSSINTINPVSMALDSEQLLVSVSSLHSTPDMDTMPSDTHDAYSIPVLDLRSFSVDDIVSEVTQAQGLSPSPSTDSYNNSNTNLSSSALPPWRALRQGESALSRMTSYLSRQEQQQHRLNYASQMTSNASNTTTANTTAASNTASAYYRLRDIPTPTAAHSRYVRPRRNSSPSDVASPAGAATTTATTTTTRRRPEPLRPEDQASTTLGRRVALRSAAMRRSQQQQQQQQQHFESGGNAREPPGFLPGSPRSTLTDHLYPPRAVSGSTSTSRPMHTVSVSASASAAAAAAVAAATAAGATAAPGTTGYARQRINELLNWEDDGTFAAGLRPANVADDDADLPMLQSISRVSSPGLVRSSDSGYTYAYSNTTTTTNTAAAAVATPWADWPRFVTATEQDPASEGFSREMQEQELAYIRQLENVSTMATGTGTERASMERNLSLRMPYSYSSLSSSSAALSSRDVQDFPATAARTIPIGLGSITRTPMTMMMRDGTPTQWQVGEEENVNSNRRYRVRRRLNLDGEEYVHQIRTDGWWPDEDDISNSNSNGNSNTSVQVPESHTTSHTNNTTSDTTTNPPGSFGQFLQRDYTNYRYFSSRSAQQRRDAALLATGATGAGAGAGAGVAALSQPPLPTRRTVTRETTESSSLPRIGFSKFLPYKSLNPPPPPFSSSFTHHQTPQLG